ncbi:MAG: RDD family protein [Thermodesulfobacteriota bacterium]
MIARCPECNNVGKLNDEFVGKQVSCPRCEVKFVAEALRQGKWHYGDGDNKIGPIKQDQFDSLVADGTIAPDTLVWCKGMDGWQPLPEFQSAGRTEEGRDHDDGGIIRTGPRLKYGGMGRRFVAKVLDLAFMLALAAMVEGLNRKLFPGSFTVNTISSVVIVTLLANMLLGVFYITWFVGKLGATPGKMVVKLKITNPAGGKIGYGHAFGRYCGEYIAALGAMSCLSLLVFWAISSLFLLTPGLTIAGAMMITLAVVYAPALFDPQRRTLYDRLCHTRVLAA